MKKLFYERPSLDELLNETAVLCDSGSVEDFTVIDDYVWQEEE